MDYFTDAQVREHVREEFSNLSADGETITRDQTICLIKKLGFNDRHEDLRDLLHDTDVNWDDHIDINGVITIIKHISRKDEATVICDLPDQNQVHARCHQLHIKVMELFKNGAVVNEQTYKQLCLEYGVPIPNDSDVQH